MDKLANILAEQFNCTVEYAKQHLPELMHDYCMYHGIINLIAVAVSVAILIACAIVIVQLIKSYRKCNESGRSTFFFDYFYGAEPNVVGTLLVITVALSIIIFTITMIVSAADAVEALCFPDVYILEKVLEVI